MARADHNFVLRILQAIGRCASPLFACMSATVVGRPRWFAKYVENGVCRLKWVAAAAIVLWGLQAYSLLKYRMQDFVDAGLYLNLNPDPHSAARIVLSFTVAVGVIGAMVFLFVMPKRLSLAGSQWASALFVLSASSEKGLQLAFSHFNYTHTTSYNLSLLLVFALAPLRLRSAVILAFCAFAVIEIASLLVGHHLTNDEVALLLTQSLAFIVLGIVLNSWHRRAFKSEWLTGIRLQRRTRQLERQKLMLETQRNVAEQQRAEIESQRGQLMQVLATALTSPVAKAYYEKGEFTSQFKSVCVIACDAVGFSDTCQKLQPDRVIAELENFFYKFDAACLRYRVEPLRGQGDSRIAVAGLWPSEGQQLHHAAIGAILAMVMFRRSLPRPEDGEMLLEDHKLLWPARIGISMGPAACGIIDTRRGASEESSIRHHVIDDSSTGRLWFDVWGDTVNVAARLEQGAEANQILVRESVLWETRGLFDYGPIHKLQVKLTTVPDVAEIIGIRRQYRDASGEPNEAFWQIYNAKECRTYKPNPRGSYSDESGLKEQP